MSPAEVTSCSCSSLACPSLVTGTPFFLAMRSTHLDVCYPRFAHLLPPVIQLVTGLSTLPLDLAGCGPSTCTTLFGPCRLPHQPQSNDLPEGSSLCASDPSFVPPHTFLSQQIIFQYICKISLHGFLLPSGESPKFLSMNWPISLSCLASSQCPLVSPILADPKSHTSVFL